MWLKKRFLGDIIPLTVKLPVYLMNFTDICIVLKFLAKIIHQSRSIKFYIYQDKIKIEKLESNENSGIAECVVK